MSKADLDVAWAIEAENYFDDDYSPSKLPADRYIAEGRLQMLSLAARRVDWTASAPIIGTEV